MKEERKKNEGKEENNVKVKWKKKSWEKKRKKNKSEGRRQWGKRMKRRTWCERREKMMNGKEGEGHDEKEEGMNTMRDKKERRMWKRKMKINDKLHKKEENDKEKEEKLQ